MKKTIALNSVAAFLLSIGVIGAATAADARSSQAGIASVYSGGRTANGEHARAGGLTAAHRVRAQCAGRHRPTLAAVGADRSDRVLVGQNYSDKEAPSCAR